MTMDVWRGFVERVEEYEEKKREAAGLLQKWRIGGEW